MGMSQFLSTQALPQLGKLGFSGPTMHLLEDLEVSPDDGALKVLPPPQCVPDQVWSAASPMPVVVHKKHFHRHAPNPQVPTSSLALAPARAPETPSSA